jgi:hypothetical protein
MHLAMHDGWLRKQTPPQKRLGAAQAIFPPQGKGLRKLAVGKYRFNRKFSHWISHLHTQESDVNERKCSASRH